MRKIAVIILCILSQVGLSAGLTECEPQGRVSVETMLPYVPQQYRTCFKEFVWPKGSLTRAETVKLVADLRKSDAAKTECGKGLLAWYDNVRVSYGKKR